ncbi:MAG: Rrf2 family transcriptional regulator [Firmicutes bacterium]|nr:Rrf2 family transcriptional regulator [Dethiobacter sp.]MBS3888517.1 Rrf2 family transcriptional regulator [Bacillota bacterium]MBS4053423.1 Rrf2 family transcriptional regulator [Thermaerobacter sp.]
MNISAKGRYALQSMLDLALASTPLVSLSSIAERQGISQNYLEHVFAALRKAGLVVSVKGAQGGYALARSAEQISAGQILRVCDVNLGQIEVDGMKPTSDTDAAAFVRNEVQKKMQESVNAILDATSLSYLAEEFFRRQCGSSLMYDI